MTGWQLGQLMKNRKLTKVTRHGWALGTNVSMTVFHRDPDTAGKALTEAFAELDRVEDIMSLYRQDSEISRLNRDGHLENPHPWLVDILQQSAELSNATNGAFDVTVQPLWKVHYQHAQAGTVPTGEALQDAIARVNWRNVAITSAGIHLRPGTEITLNGIAQGFAADAVSRVFRREGIEHALIDTGEIGTVGSHAEKEAWSIGIKHPRNEQDLLGLAALNGRCLATSGDYETRFSEDYSQHHLLDPKTGHSPTELSSVTVVAETAVQADALSTAVFLVGVKEGQRLVETTPGADALFVSKGGQVTRTDGFPLIS